jgi:ABC-type bacteriocin/lantibiotic exporter with double-glycine peptidase domain
MNDVKKVLSAVISIVGAVILFMIAWPLFLAVFVIIVGFFLWLTWQAKVVVANSEQYEQSNQTSDDIEHPSSHMDVIEVEYQEKEIK